MDSEEDFDIILIKAGIQEMVSVGESEPEERPLWRAVLCQLFYDGTRRISKVEGPEVDVDRQDARRFFTKTAGVTAMDCAAVCEFAGFDVEKVRAGFIRLVDAQRTFYRRIN